jgi:hypothetical protein
MFDRLCEAVFHTKRSVHHLCCSYVVLVSSQGTWGRPGDESKGDELDPNDPNYASDEESAPANWSYDPTADTQVKFASSLDDLAAFKKTVKAACAEYVQSNDANEFSRILAGQPSVFHQDLPYILIKYSLDLTDVERARVSNLLLALHKGGLITHTQMGAGMRKLYNSLSDLLVDCPTAKIQLREHVQFAVAAGILDAALAKSLEEEQEALSDAAKVTEVKKKIDSILSEFFRSESIPEAVTALRELHATYLGFEIVKRLISKSLDLGHRQREGASVFLADQSGSLLSSNDVEKGFIALLERVDDLRLDVPEVLKYLSIFVARAVVDEVLPPAFLVRVDLGAHDAGTQVLTQASALLKQENSSDALLYAWENLQETEDSQKKQKAAPAAHAAAAASQ